MAVVFSDGLFPEWGRLNKAGTVSQFGGLAVPVCLLVRVQTAWSG